MILDTPEKVARAERNVQSYIDQKNQEKEFKETSGRIYEDLLSLHLSMNDARRWYYSPNHYLRDRRPIDYCKENKHALVLKVAKDEISRLEWVVNS